MTEARAAEFRLTGTLHIYALHQISASEMTTLLMEKPLWAIPVFWANVPHRRPDTKELTGLTFVQIWPNIQGEPFGHPIGTIHTDRT